MWSAPTAEAVRPADRSGGYGFFGVEVAVEVEVPADGDRVDVDHCAGEVPPDTPPTVPTHVPAGVPAGANAVPVGGSSRDRTFPAAS